MTKRIPIYFSIISATTLPLFSLSLIDNSSAKEIKQKSISFATFTQKANIYQNMTPRQQEIMRKLWAQFDNIDEQNRIIFFHHLDFLSKQWIDHKGILRDGQISKTQATEIKEYINKRLKISDTAESDQTEKE